MRLSEAILLGSVGSKQGFGPRSMYSNSPTKCAMGAALFVSGIKVNDENGNDEVEKLWPWVATYVTPPIKIRSHKNSVYDRDQIRILGVIWRLNDWLKWTRPQIAAWVATQEALYDPEVVNQSITEVECVTR